jgi:hypothetical protein
MPRLIAAKTNFTAGEVSPRVLGRGDLRGYENGAAKLRNAVIHPTGGVSRRPGLRYVGDAAGKARLVAFEFNVEQTYLLVFTHLRMEVYGDDEFLAWIATPWTEAALDRLGWTQSADTLFVCHPDFKPRRITRTSDTAWSIAEYAFFEKDGVVRQPLYRFTPDGLTLTPSATTGSITLAASAAVFVAGHVGTRLRIKGKEVEIVSVASGTSAGATVKETLLDTAATDDWEEQAFSAVRGWPVSATFHQDRLIFGGARDVPNRVWMSCIGEFENFDLGTGLDDEAIDFALMSDQVNAVVAVVSGRHLQVFTTGGEWAVTGEPLTPSRVQVRRHTRVGSSPDRAIPPRTVDGASLYMARSGKELREFAYTDIEQGYQSTDLTTLAPHLLTGPIDQDFDADDRLFHVVNADGTLASLTIFRAEQVNAWTLQTTDGAFEAVAVAGGRAYVVVSRGGTRRIERFDPALATDSALLGESGTPKTNWSGLGHLEGRSVIVVADGLVVRGLSVASGAVVLPRAARKVEIGLPFTHAIEPLPPVVGAGQIGVTQVAPARLVRAIFRVVETKALRVDVGLGLRDVPFLRLGETLLDAGPAAFTGDKVLRGLGWARGLERPLWRIEQDAPLAMQLLSVTTEIKGND